MAQSLTSEGSTTASTKIGGYSNHTQSMAWHNTGKLVAASTYLPTDVAHDHCLGNTITCQTIQQGISPVGKGCPMMDHYTPQVSETWSSNWQDIPADELAYQCTPRLESREWEYIPRAYQPVLPICRNTGDTGIALCVTGGCP